MLFEIEVVLPLPAGAFTNVNGCVKVIPVANLTPPQYKRVLNS